MEKIYIFGHKKPDTDSVTSAIALSYLKNQLGYNTSPRVLGDINRETEYVLKTFNIPEPKYLNDVRLQIKDINYKKDYFVHYKDSILKAYNYMISNKINTLPVINDINKFIGIVSMKDIAKDFISDTFDLLNTSYTNILDTIEGTEMLRFDEELKGNIILASYKGTTFMETITVDRNTILIVGDRHDVIEHAIINKARLIIITGNRKIKDEHLKLAEINQVNIIYTPFFSFKVARFISFCNYIDNIALKNGVIYFDQYEDVNDFIDIANKSKFSVYPVVNKNLECLGVIKLADLASKKRKNVILVDHNEAEQSVDGLDEANILEIIDHHKIGTLGTTLPINFRNMPVGSTNSIIYMLYKENQIPIPKDIAGLMLSGILSDTMLFKSPTTTQIDIEVVTSLSDILQINYQEYGMKMFKTGTSLKGKTKEEVLYTDFKNFTVDNKKIGIGQIFTLNIDEVFNEQNEYTNLIESIKENNGYFIVALFITDILKNGSYILFNKSATDVLDNSFEIKNLEQGSYLNEIVSRKKQIVPNIMKTIEKK